MRHPQSPWCPQRGLEETSDLAQPELGQENQRWTAEISGFHSGEYEQRGVQIRRQHGS